MEEEECNYLDGSITDGTRELGTDEMISLEEFKRRVYIMDINSKAELRSRYIRKFVNTNDSHYKTSILDTPKCIDGECYTGFFWSAFMNLCG